ncbi:protein BNIP5 isoform X2 [Choloepus didactylus]|uniref:protein BNIP5 isoform X2 n=1 Tax=Choloepus didactylus TaxID=27675 RepID=UPI0018A070D1|nr:protein BNIP5 isoform X2 [Choloepus didactylus]
MAQWAASAAPAAVSKGAVCFGCSSMENPRAPKKSLSARKARSLDRPQIPRKDSESGHCQCLSLYTAPCKRVLRRTASDGPRCLERQAQPLEAPGTLAAALCLEETQEFLPSEQRPPQDTKKDKAQKRASPGWLKTLLYFFLRTGPEEPREKASRKPKGRDGLSQPVDLPETPGEPAIRKKAHDKKASRRKAFGHKKHVAEETKGAGLPVTAALGSEEADLGPARRGREAPDLHGCLLIKAGVSDVSSQATDHRPEEERKPEGAPESKDDIIQKIVELLQKVGDQWEAERRQVQQLELAPQNTAPAIRKKSQEKKPSIKRGFSLKKHHSEEPKRAGAAGTASPEAQPHRKHSFLPMCVGGHRPSIPSSSDLEEPEVQEALPTDIGHPSSSELSTQEGSWGPEEELQLDRASESKFLQKIIDLLQDAKEQGAEKRRQAQQPEMAVENPAPVCRKKSQERKPSFRRPFSLKKHGSKEPKRAGTAGAASPEAGLPRKHGFLPTCVGGHRPSIPLSLDLEHLEFQEPSPANRGPVGSPETPSEAGSCKPEGAPQLEGACESKEMIIEKLVALLQKVDGKLGEQIRRHPSFKRFLYKFSDSNLRELAAALHSQDPLPPEPDRNLAGRPYQFADGLAKKFAGNHSHAVPRLMGLVCHYSQHTYAQFSYRETLMHTTSPQTQSPD